MLQLAPHSSGEFSLILRRGAHTTLHAVDRSGQPLNGATVTARYEEGPWLPAMLLVERTGQGTYELGRLCPGTWDFRVHHPSTGRMTQRRAIGNQPAVTVVIAPE